MPPIPPNLWSDAMALAYNHETGNFDFLIGEDVWADMSKNLGKIVSIDYYVDGYGHDIADAVLDSGRRINCRMLVSTGQDD